MSSLPLVALTSFGVESVVAEELGALGYGGLAVENGKVTFRGSDRDIAQANIHLRSADRVVVRMAEFPATDFETLFQGVRSIPWEEVIPRNGKMHVTGKSVMSALHSVPDCQAVAKKAVVEAMRRRYRERQFPETGPLYRIEIALYKDRATVTLDTTGPGLHKRGYRQETGEAPLRETLAAALIMLTGWRPGMPFADPLCGSGTIAIEAAMIGRNMAPGLRRSFIAEQWPHIPRTVWQAARKEAAERVTDPQGTILASDADGLVLRRAAHNAERAGVAGTIRFEKRPLESFRTGEREGWIICNPPYGERLGDTRESERIYRELGRIYQVLGGWSLGALSPHPRFEKWFGKKADRRRKVYNGTIKCYFYQYVRNAAASGKLKVESGKRCYTLPAPRLHPAGVPVKGKA